jgi:hypothetical protein
MILSRSGGHFYLAESGHLYLALISTFRITGQMVNCGATAVSRGYCRPRPVKTTSC